MKYLFQIFWLFAILSACSSKSDSGNLISDYHFIIKDSIRIDYQGNFFMLDFEPESGLFLARNNRTEEYLFLDDFGSILHRFNLQQDGPNAISMAQGVGFLDSKFTVMDSNKGIIQFSNDGEIVHQIDIPKEYFYINGLNGVANWFGEELMYYRPERGEVSLENPISFFKKLYQSPLLEIFDLKTKTIRNTMEFPPGTIYEDGNFYQWTFPSLVKVSEEEWLIYFLAERKYHVYHKEAWELVYQKTIDLDIANAVNTIGVPIENWEDYYEKSKFNVFGRIERLYALDEEILVVYTKGVPEDIARTNYSENMQERAEFINRIPRYAAVLDKSHQMLQKDIPLPKGMIFSTVVNNKGQIIALKDQEYFGVEEDVVTLYKVEIGKSN
ncbi:hypothetical protein [Aquiflexum lacus]|uniref:hypothetical protein n=1 Tax=Aquiflexum lacus TaxID=2483805 RepID=UPI001892E060|nr:hypothetical protein [Aquiflexum lacus]